MKDKKIALFILSGVIVFAANCALALGLGEITLNSSLNEPLDAEIQLLDTGDLSTDEIVVGFADSKEFERRKLERHFFYNDFQFQVIKRSEHEAVVRITSSKSITEPYLGIILEVRWSDGRLLREYSLLMDMPLPAP